MEFLAGLILGLALGLILGPRMDYVDFKSDYERRLKSKARKGK